MLESSYFVQMGDAEVVVTWLKHCSACSQFDACHFSLPDCGDLNSIQKEWKKINENISLYACIYVENIVPFEIPLVRFHPGCNQSRCTQMHPELPGLPPGPAVHLPMFDQQDVRRELRQGPREGHDRGFDRRHGRPGRERGDRRHGPMDGAEWARRWRDRWSRRHGDAWNMVVCQNLVPLVNIKIAGKWMFIPLKMVFIGIDP